MTHFEPPPPTPSRARLSPPAHICGPLAPYSPHRRERALWIAAQDASRTSRQLAKVLGVTPTIVSEACPGRDGRFGVANVPRTRRHVTLPDAPCLPAVCDETAPPRGIMSTPRGSARIAAVIAAIRAEHHRHTQHEDHA